jgi:uncharacterized RDD family membrane protein YckC
MMQLQHDQFEYAGFLRRLLAFGIDNLLLSVISTALIVVLFGFEQLQQLQSGNLSSFTDWRTLLVNQLVPALWVVGFWVTWLATPGKLLMDCQIVDAKTLGKPHWGKLVIRYLGYIISAIPLGLGFLWILFDKHNRSWHDMLSGTIVIMQDESLWAEPVFSPANG